MNRLGVWLCVLAGLFATPAGAAVAVQVLATDPPGADVELSARQTFYLRLRYESDRPVQIWVRPYFRGTAVAAGSNPSRRYPAGRGEALGWFFLFDAGSEVDEVRISAGDGSVAGTPVVARYPLQVRSTAATAVATAESDWVARLRALDATAAREARERLASAPADPAGGILMAGFMLAMFAVGLAGFAAPAWAAWRWRGGWRILAALPALALAFVLLRIVVDTTIDPTAHNLWPFEVLIAGGLGLAYLAVVAILRRLLARPSAN